MWDIWNRECEIWDKNLGTSIYYSAEIGADTMQAHVKITSCLVPSKYIKRQCLVGGLYRCNFAYMFPILSLRTTRKNCRVCRCRCALAGSADPSPKGRNGGDLPQSWMNKAALFGLRWYAYPTFLLMLIGCHWVRWLRESRPWKTGLSSGFVSVKTPSYEITEIGMIWLNEKEKKKEINWNID